MHQSVLSVIREEGQDREEFLVSGRNVAIIGKEIAITAGAADEGVVLADIKTGEVVVTAEIVSTTLIETVCTFAALREWPRRAMDSLKLPWLAGRRATAASPHRARSRLSAIKPLQRLRHGLFGIIRTL